MPTCPFCGTYSTLCYKGTCGFKGTTYDTTFTCYNNDGDDGSILLIPFYFLMFVFYMFYYIFFALAYACMYIGIGLKFGFLYAITVMQQINKYICDANYRTETNKIFIEYIKESMIIILFFSFLGLIIYIPYLINNKIYINIYEYFNQTSIGKELYETYEALSNGKSIICNARGCHK
jgi:hypothetical protein